MCPAVVYRTCMFQMAEEGKGGTAARLSNRYIRGPAFTVADTAKPWRYCGEPVERGSFCGRHAEVCYRVPPTRDRKGGAHG